MRTENWQAQLASGLAARAPPLPAELCDALCRYIELLHRWNTTYNLTAVRDPAEMVTRHLLDSLSVLPFLHGDSIVDVGTGAGLPGIPLALACPEKQFVLLDSNGKKTRFVTHVATTLDLRNVAVVHARAENYRPVQPFATVISRAFAAILDFLRLAGHLGAADGRFLAMKGEVPAKELRALPAGFMTNVHPLKVPGLKARRCVVEIQKT